MSPSTSVAASLTPSIRKDLVIQVLTKTEPVSHLAAQHQVSRKFLYQQRHKADEALDKAFAESTDDKAVLFYRGRHRLYNFGPQLIETLLGNSCGCFKQCIQCKVAF